MMIGHILDIYCTHTAHIVRLLLGDSPTNARLHLGCSECRGTIKRKLCPLENGVPRGKRDFSATVPERTGSEGYVGLASPIGIETDTGGDGRGGTGACEVSAVDPRDVVLPHLHVELAVV